MADNYTLCLVGAMDHLWFYQIIIFPEPISLLTPKTLQTQLQPQTIPNSIKDQPSLNNISQSAPLLDQEFTLHSSPPITPPQDDDDCNNNNIEDEEQRSPPPLIKERPTRVGLTKTKTRSHSSSPSTQKRSKKLLLYSSSEGTLPTTNNNYMAGSFNNKSLWDLELEEVKGFIDLGFTFNKEQISQRLMRVVPGLQRLGELKNMQKLNDQSPSSAVISAAAADEEVANKDDDEIDDDHHHHQEEEYHDEEEEEKTRGIMRPYLSEAWLIKRPDSPLLNLRIPRVSAADDMKKHLVFWARTVASEIHQES